MCKLSSRFVSVCLLLFISFSSFAFEIAFDNQNRPLKWGERTLGTTGGTVTYGFSTDAFCPAGVCNQNDVVSLDDFMPTGYESSIAKAFDAWSAVANIDFVMADNPTDAQIKIAGDNGIDGQGLAYAWFPTVGDVFFNPSVVWSLADTGTSSSIFLVALHEIGHSLGLEHSFRGTVLYDFIDPSLTGLTADDIAGIQALYGARVAAVPLPAAFWMLLVALFSLSRTTRQA